MLEQPLDDLKTLLKDGKHLCLLPVSQVKPRIPVRLSQQAILYPRNSVDQFSMNIVSYPKYELDKIARRVHAIGPIVFDMNTPEGAWMPSAATGVTLQEFFAEPHLAFPATLDWESFLSPKSHDIHIAIIARAIQNARPHVNEMATLIPRTRLPNASQPKCGHISGSPFSAALFYTPDDNESYILAGKIEEA